MAEPSDPSKPVDKPLSGKVGRYEIKGPLGKGAMGQVYLARDTMLDRDVALKVMVAQIADDPELKARFEREAKAVAKMTHPNVVNVYDRGEHTDGSPFIVMELLKGKDLHKRMRQSPPLTLEEKVGIIGQVLKGLGHAHKAGVFHRDIKPANIWIQDDGAVKLMDFGVAHQTGQSMTGTGNVVGTADYMSPEQVQGKKVDGRSDLFSVGCMLFELAAGRRPFHSDNLMAIFYKITHEEANFDLIPQGADYDALMPVLKKALAKTLPERYQSAEEFAVDLREWLKAHATTSSSQSVLEALVDLEAPTHPPAAMTETGGPGEGGTVELAPGRRPTVVPRKPTLAPTRAGAKTVVETGPTLRPGPTRVLPTPQPSRAPARVQPEARPSVLPWVAMGLALVAVGVAGYLAWKSQQPQPAAVAVVTPTTTPPPPTALATPTPTPPPVTAAPAPEFGEAGGKAAASVKQAQSAFAAGNYDKAVAAAQAALREDAASAPAKKLLEQALVGQKAADQVRTGDAALGRGDTAAAEAAADEAYRIAPWDKGAVGLQRRIAEAKAQAQRDADARAANARTAQLTAALNDAGTALQAKQYEAAIAAYDRALQLEPGNAAAQTGRAAAIGAKSLADAAASGARSGGPVKSFVQGRTEAKAAASRGMAGFDETAGVTVHQGTSAVGLPGTIVFEATPQVPKPGEGFKVSVYLSNEGAQPIPLAPTITVSTTLDGRLQRGPIAPSTATVAPGQRGLVYQTPSGMVWKDNTQSWVMEVLVTTQRNETYRNTLTWK